jgi:hypothetical protein
MAAERYSIGLASLCWASLTAVCALVPGMFIPEKMFDPRAVALPAATTRLAAGAIR